jgi:alpha-amylase
VIDHHDGHPFSTGKSMTATTTGKYVANPGGGVMMQAFTGMYLLVETGGSKYKSNSMVKCWYRFHLASSGI